MNSRNTLPRVYTYQRFRLVLPDFKLVKFKMGCIGQKPSSLFVALQNCSCSEQKVASLLM